MDDDIAAALAEQQDELTALLAGLADDAWSRPSPCEGWDVADVVLHLVQTNDLAVASAEDRMPSWSGADVDAAAADAVSGQRGAAPAGLLGRWTAGVDQLRAALAGRSPSDRVMWVVGQLSVRTLTTTRLAETWIHTTDVADAVGVELSPAERLRHVARLAWRTLPYAFERAGRPAPGPVAFHLTGPTGAAWDFDPGEPATTTVTGDGVELCRVAARRIDPASTSLHAEGPDAEAVLALVRTYA